MLPRPASVALAIVCKKGMPMYIWPCAGMPLALPSWLLPSVPGVKPRMRKAQHPRERPLPTNKPRFGRDPNAHTRPAKKQKVGEDTDAHIHPAKNQEHSRGRDTLTDPAKTSEDADNVTKRPVLRLPAMSARDNTPGLGAGHAEGDMVTPEQGSVWASPTKATASAGTGAVLGCSSLHQQLFPDMDKSQHSRRIATKKSGKQADPGRPQTRVQVYESVRAAQRCGYCKTCMNRSMKKACLTRRAEMDMANVAVV